MSFSINDYYEKLRRIVTSGSRYRLAVIGVNESALSSIPGNMKILDIGMETASAVERISCGYGKSEAKIQMETAEAVERIVRQHIFMDEGLGSVVIMENFGILFEPGLHIDVTGLLRRISKNTLTVLLWPGEMDGTALHFLGKESKYTIRQTDINYTII